MNSEFVLVIVIILAIILFRKLNIQEQKIEFLMKELDELRQRTHKKATEKTPSIDPAPAVKPADPPARNAPEKISSAVTRSRQTTEPFKRPGDVSVTNTDSSGMLSPLLESLRNNWMLWAGTLSVGLAGIFMANYAVTSGLLGPTVQFSLVCMVGLLLHIAAARLWSKHAGNSSISGALAGGGSITLYAISLAGLHHFQILSPLIAFFLMAAVAFGTLFLALRYGPVLAISGLIGAYAVPLMVSGDSGNIAAVLAYVFIITVSGLGLLRFVYRPWLWHSILIASGLWWFLGLQSGDARSSLIIYMAVTLAAFIWVPGTATHSEKNHTKIVLISISIATLLTVLISNSVYYSYLALIVTAAIATRKSPQLQPALWSITAALATGWSIVALSDSNLATSDNLPSFMVMAAALSSLLGAWFWSKAPANHYHASASILTPFIWMLTAYLTYRETFDAILWSAAIMSTCAIYAVISYMLLRTSQQRGLSVWPVLGFHASYSLAAAAYFTEATLTTALSLQLISLSLLICRYPEIKLDTLLKIIIAVIVVRLTTNPWLLNYGNESHWSLWTYGAAFLCSVFATYLQPADNIIRRWLEAASLHIFVLFAGAELRYWLYDGEIFSAHYGFTEGAVNALLWGSLAITYQIRAQVSESMRSLYLLLSKAMLLMAGLSYLSLVTVNNPLVSGDVFSKTPIFNLITLAFGGPVLIALVYRIRATSHARRLINWTAVALAAIFSAFSVRQLWHDGDLGINQGLPDGEWYTYSAVALAAAVATLVTAFYLKANNLQRYGSLFMAAVTLKIFISDMSALEGLWRAASFMGLGLVLIAMAWMYKNTRHSH